MMALQTATRPQGAWLLSQMAKTGVLCLWGSPTHLGKLSALPIAALTGLPPAGQLPLRSAVLQPEASHQFVMKSLV